MLLHLHKAFSLLLCELSAVCAVFIIAHNDHADAEEYYAEDNEDYSSDPQHALRHLTDHRSV